MAAEPIILNPIGWVQLQLLGGWRRQLGICGAYAGAVLLFCVLIFRAVRDTTSVATFCDSALVLLNVVEAAVLFLLGTNAVRGAIRRDFATDMINSHRLTAMSGYTAVLGYLTGATSQVLALTAVNWVIGTILAQLSSLPAAQARYAPTVLLVMAGCLTILVWTFSSLMALATRGKVGITGLLIVLGILANFKVVYILPGLALLVPATVITELRNRQITGIDAASLILSMLAQLALAFTFYLAASRKFLRDDVSAFRGTLGYGLLALCALLGATAIGYLPPPTGLFAFHPFMEPANQLIATLCALALIGIVPVGDAAKASADWSKRHAKDPQFAGPSPRSFLDAPIISALIVLSILVVVLIPDRQGAAALITELLYSGRLACIAVIFILSQFTVSGLLRYTYAVMPRAMWIIILYLVIFWAIPPFADLSWEVIMERDPMEGRTMLFTCSPVGAWIACCTGLPAPIWPGVAVQAMLAAGVVMMGKRGRRPRDRRIEAQGTEYSVRTSLIKP